MSEWCDVTRRQPRHEKKSQGWRAQSGQRAPEWRCAACKVLSFLSRDRCRGCNKRDEHINEWAQTAAWPMQGRGFRLVSKTKVAAQALAVARQRRCPKIASASWKARSEGGDCDEAEDGPSPISSNRRVQREGDGHTSSKRNRRWCRPKWTATSSCWKPRCQYPQVNVSLVKTLEALTGIIDSI